MRSERHGPDQTRRNRTYDDLLSLPDDGKRYEIIEGDLYEMPAPGWEHVIVVMNLVRLLDAIVEALGAGSPPLLPKSSSMAPIPSSQTSS